ncbi:MAG: hypothetical protein H6719_21590 [Sandaracinaceae bacterium]|nr:hypothetical protein [Sandaracinaceae bacterium]
MTAYRDDAAALRHRLEIETARADRAEAKLGRFERGRDVAWGGDIALFVARALLIVVPLGFAAWFLFFFGLVVVFDAFDDTRGLMALFAVLISPLFVAGPLAAYTTERPSRFGWGLALFTYLFMLAPFPPAALYGLAILLRGRTRDAVFGPLSSQVRVAIEDDGEAATAAAPEAEAADDDEVRTSRSARAAS